jgi:hypothetical protein
MAADHATRWLIRRDVEPSLELPAMVAWTRDDLAGHCKKRNGIAMVCEDSDQQIVGWIAYTLHAENIHVENIATEDWESSPATALIQRLLNKMGHRRDLITVSVPDYQDDILVFFRACGFVVWQQDRDIIHMRYDLPISTELVEIGGETCRRSTGFPCMLPEGF